MKKHRSISDIAIVLLAGILLSSTSCQRPMGPKDDTTDWESILATTTETIRTDTESSASVDETNGDETTDPVGNEDDETTDAVPERLPGDFHVLEGYRVVLAENASTNLKTAAESFASVLQSATGVKLRIVTDWEDGPVKRIGKEFVVGDTTRRDECLVDPTLADGLFQIARRDEKFFFLAKDEAGVILAMRYLITVYLTPGNPDRLEIISQEELFGLTDGESFVGDSFSRYQIDIETLDAYIAAHDVICVIDCKVDNTGAMDVTELLQYLHNSGKRIYYPNGEYLFNGETLCFTGGVEFESQDGVVIHNSISRNPVVNFDVFGNLIGLQQNHLEYKVGEEGSKHGSLVSPPLSTMKNDTDVDFLPIFYNDFGLMKSLNQSWHGWFYWSWNHQDNVTPGYDPQRHPLLGWYYGDDPVVLDWICYWLRQYGINQMIILSTPYRDVWQNPRNSGHWHYQLFNHVKNFDEMEYVLEVDHMNQDPVELLRHWKEVIRYYRDYPHYYTRVVDGKTLAVVYNWQDNVMSGKLGGDAAYADMMIEVSNYAKAQLGVDGIMVMGRAMNDFSAELTEMLKSAGVYRYAAGYEPNCIEKQGTLKTYERYVENFNGDLAKKNTVLAISTGMFSHTHPSGWTISGNTPALFELWATKAVTYLREKKPLLPVVTIYNISEWGEGGPGLQPNVQDGFGYLEAIANALGITPGVSN